MAARRERQLGIIGASGARSGGRTKSLGIGMAADILKADETIVREGVKEGAERASWRRDDRSIRILVGVKRASGRRRVAKSSRKHDDFKSCKYSASCRPGRCSPKTGRGPRKGASEYHTRRAKNQQSCQPPLASPSHSGTTAHRPSDMLSIAITAARARVLSRHCELRPLEPERAADARDGQRSACSRPCLRA